MLFTGGRTQRDGAAGKGSSSEAVHADELQRVAMYCLHEQMGLQSGTIILHVGSVKREQWPGARFSSPLSPAAAAALLHLAGCTVQGFPSITLTFLHFVVTFIGLRICAALGVFTFKALDPKRVLPLALAFCGFVVFTNLSLTHNTVGFYQMAKTSTTPVIVVLQFLFYQKRFPWTILASLVGGALRLSPRVTFSGLADRLLTAAY